MRYKFTCNRAYSLECVEFSVPISINHFTASSNSSIILEANVAGYDQYCVNLFRS